MSRFNRVKELFNAVRAEGPQFVLFSFFGYTALDFIGNNVAFATICSGPSMNPTINTSGDGLFVICTKEFKLGDVVVAKSPTDSNKRKVHSITIVLY